MEEQPAASNMLKHAIALPALAKIMVPPVC
jgi:hypothetical protein